MTQIINLRSLSRQRGGLTVCLALLLPACVPPPGPNPAPAAAAAPADPILRAVAGATPNLPVSVVSPGYAGTVTLTVTADYISAQGQECRAYTLSNGGVAPGLPSHLACTDGANWREIPSLAPAMNSGISP